MAASRYSLRRVSSSIGAISLGIVKDHLRVDGDDENELILQYVDAAVNYAEAFTGRSIADSAWRLSVAPPPSARLLLPKPPLVSVGSVSLLLPDGLEVIDPSEYAADADEEPGVLTFRTAPHAPVRVEYRAGYVTPAEVPGGILSAVLLMVGHLYAHREDVVTGTIATKMPQGTDALLWGYRAFG